MSEENLTSQETPPLIWDISTRIFHWLLVLLVLFQWLSGEFLEGWIDWHVLAGYCLLALLIFRITWGFVGPEYARFSSFVRGPRAILNYAKTVMDRDSVHHASHNPMGGLVVVVMLTLLLLQAVSGLFIDDAIFTSGPYYHAVPAYWQDVFNRVHGTAFDILIYIIGLHILAIVFYQFYKGQQLVAAMWHGRKPGTFKAITDHKWLLAIILVIVISALVYVVVEVLPPPVEDDFYGF